MTVYHGVMQNVIGEDREAAVAAMDNDEDFDRWMQEYQRSMQEKLRNKPGSKGGRRLTNEQYLNRFARQHGGEEE